MKQNLITLAMFPFGMPVVRLGDGNTQLELSYDSADDIPAGMESLYTEKDGKQVLTGVKGMKTQADIDRLQTALTKERNDHKTVRTQLSSLSSYGTIEEITANLDRIPQSSKLSRARATQRTLKKSSQRVWPRYSVSSMKR